MTHREREAIERRILMEREERMASISGKALPSIPQRGLSADSRLCMSSARLARKQREDERLRKVVETFDLCARDAAERLGLKMWLLYRLRRTACRKGLVS